MSLVKFELEVGKESKEVVDFIVELVKEIKAGKSAMEIAGGSLPGLMLAVGGFQAIPEELKGKSAFDLGAYAVSKAKELV